MDSNFGINEHFPMVPDSPLRMNLGSICAIQVLIHSSNRDYVSMSCVVERSTLRTTAFKLEFLENIHCNSQIIGNERKVKTIMPEHVLIWLLESILKFRDRAGSWLMIQNPSSLPFCGQCANFLVPDCWCTGEATWGIWVPPYGTCSEDGVLVRGTYSAFRTPYKEALGTYSILQVPSTSEDHPGTVQQPWLMIGLLNIYSVLRTRGKVLRMHTRIRGESDLSGMTRMKATEWGWATVKMSRWRKWWQSSRSSLKKPLAGNNHRLAGS